MESVISLTGFGSPRTSRGRFFDSKDKEKRGEQVFTTSGIYPVTGHINHACIRNCQRSFIGDMQIVRATQDLDPDTELLFWYQEPRMFDSYHETQERLRSWRFKCACDLCLARKDTTRTTIQRRKALGEELKRAMGQDGSSSSRRVDVYKARKVLEQLEATYATAERQPGAMIMRLELWDPYIALGNALLVDKKHRDAIDATVLGLEALGFVIAADTARRRTAPKAGKPEFRVEKWGLVNEYCVEAFLTLFHAHRVLAPELLMEIRAYVETVFSMVVGEKDTVLDVFPDLGLL